MQALSQGRPSLLSTMTSLKRSRVGNILFIYGAVPPAVQQHYTEMPLQPCIIKVVKAVITKRTRPSALSFCI